MIIVTPTKEKYDNEEGWWIEGDIKEVWNEVNDRLQHDRPIEPVYSHLRLQVVDIDKSGLPNKLIVRLYRNLLAGD